MQLVSLYLCMSVALEADRSELSIDQGLANGI